jgi:cysteine synthase A
LPKKALIVTVFPDDNKKYLSTDLLGKEPVKENFLSPHVNLLSYKSFKRVCETCCKPEECVDTNSPDLREKTKLPECPRRAKNV